MRQIISNFSSLGRRRLMIMGGVFALVMAIIIGGAGYVMSPTYRPMASGLTPSEAAPMVDALEKAGFRPRLSTDGSVVSVPEQDMARARMSVAEAGLPASKTAGWEIFDNASGIGMNSFVQRLNRVRALEGELARSIQTMDSVESARVHVVLPERETFSQERPEASASVIVKTRNGASFERRQAIAIRNLVASAIPGLAQDKVTVLSASGELILGEEDAASGAGIAMTRAAIEDRIARNIENILSAHVGAGNVRVRVAADISTDRQVRVSQSFDPEQRVARSVSTLSEQVQNSSAGAGNVDVANNMPGVENGGGAGGGRNENRSKNQDETLFEIGNEKVETVTDPGSVRRLTVAVVVNGRMDGENYVERTQEELDRMLGLVRSAAGTDEQRGDVITVESLRFVDGLAGDEAGSGGIGQVLSDNSGGLIRAGSIILIVVLVLLLGVRPLLRQVREIGQAQQAAAAAEAAAVSDAGVADPASPQSAPAIMEGDEEYVPIASVRGNVMKRYIDELSMLVETSPEESLRTLRSWIKNAG